MNSENEIEGEQEGTTGHSMGSPAHSTAPIKTGRKNKGKAGHLSSLEATRPRPPIHSRV